MIHSVDKEWALRVPPIEIANALFREHEDVRFFFALSLSDMSDVPFQTKIRGEFLSLNEKLISGELSESVKSENLAHFQGMAREMISFLNIGFAQKENREKEAAEAEDFHEKAKELLAEMF